MRLSIGATGPGIGPRRAIESYGKEAAGRVFDRRVVRRLLAYVRPYRAADGIGLWVIARRIRAHVGDPLPHQGGDRPVHRTTAMR